MGPRLTLYLFLTVIIIFVVAVLVTRKGGSDGKK